MGETKPATDYDLGSARRYIENDDDLPPELTERILARLDQREAELKLATAVCRRVSRARANDWTPHEAHEAFAALEDWERTTNKPPGAPGK